MDTNEGPSQGDTIRFKVEGFWALAVIIAALATCAVCDHNESQVEKACFEAGNDPEECDL